MKLGTPVVEFIQSVVKTCKLVGIENAVLSQTIVGGLHDDRVVAIIHTDNIPKLPFNAIGLTRLSELQTRLDVVGALPDFSIEADIKPNTDYVFKLVLKAKGTKVDYRCGDPARIEYKKASKDTLKYKVKLHESVVTMLAKGISAMGTDSVTLISNSEGVSFELVDSTNDIFKYTFPDPAVCLNGETEAKFAHKYSTKLLLATFKNNPTGTFEVGEAGALRILVNGITTYGVPVVKIG